MPLDLGAKGTCQIGGNVATNAGGLRLLQVVTPDGKIVNLGQPLRKDNTGFDLKQLFIGSEGTLGIITKVSILTPAAVLRLPSYTHVQKAFAHAKADLTEILSAYEFWDSECSDLVLSHMEGTRPLLPTSPDSFYVLIETSGSNETHDSEKLMGFLDKVMGDGIVDEGTLADAVAQKSAMWRFRESIGEACGKDAGGGNLKYDLSVPVTQLYDVVYDLRKRFKDLGLDERYGKAVGFGHMGDGNLHLNVTGTKWDEEVVKAGSRFISAEHGLGVMKAPYVGYSKSKDAIAMMKDLKKFIKSAYNANIANEVFFKIISLSEIIAKIRIIRSRV
ncbi:FAD-linked oxidase-like protein [Chytridium lagenaria]|nr:FAD-linked oxidase-like protein [Chytridium lagenaria]